MIRNVRKSITAVAFGLFTVAALADSGAFFRAIKQDNDVAMRSLLASGVDPNTKDEKGVPGLYMALQEGSLRVARLLIDSPRLKPETRNATDESPLMMAALKGHLDLARQLIARDADVNKPGWTPLHYAATGGHLDIMRLLLEEHAFIDAQSPNGTTPLMMAVRYGTADAARLLISEGADPSLKNQLGLSAVDFAMRADRQDMVQLVAEAVRRRQPDRGKW